METEGLKIPEHIAIIMDGNGRWAKKRHMPRTYGHKIGAEVLEQTLENCDDLGVKYLTVYAFSTENWARPLEEVRVIMDLFRRYLVSTIDKCNRNNVRCRIIGERNKFDPDIVDAINNLEEQTKQNTGINFIIAMNYGSRDELVRGFKQMAKKIEAGEIKPDEIDESLISAYLDTKDIPDPDLLIRTSGEERLSNFLLWQLAYTEFYFTDVNWPDFDLKELMNAIRKYNSRDRRFGGLK